MISINDENLSDVPSRKENETSRGRRQARDEVKKRENRSRLGKEENTHSIRIGWLQAARGNPFSLSGRR